MSNSFNFGKFLSQFNIDQDSANTNSGLTYENLVLREYSKFCTPLRVVQVLETPRGPTEHQEWAVGCVLPYLEDNGIGAVSLNMDTLAPVHETPETLVVRPYGYVNSILLACLQDLSIWEIELATRKAQYIQAILPRLGIGANWTLSPVNPSLEKPFARFGTITTPEQAQNPYIHVNDIF